MDPNVEPNYYSYNMYNMYKYHTDIPLIEELPNSKGKLQLPDTITVIPKSIKLTQTINKYCRNNSSFIYKNSNIKYNKRQKFHRYK